MARTPYSAVTAWITEAALAHPLDLGPCVAERLAVTRATAARLVRRLVADQWLVREGTPRRPRHAPGLLRQVVRRYPLAGLDEHTPWARDFAPCLALPEPVARLAQHAFTELVNNAIDHSGGSGVTVSMRQTPAHLQLLVSDDGCGLFERLGRHFDLHDPAHAMFELGKGKLSSQPDRHSGRGLYFTTRIADVLDLHANAHAFQHRAWQPQRWQRARAAVRGGTSVFVAIALDTAVRLDAVLREHSLDGQGYAFERTRVPLRLLTGAQTALASRAQARQVGARLAQFRRAELDFDGIAEIGHGFADELLRVMARERPDTEIVPLNAPPQVRAMLDGVRREMA